MQFTALSLFSSAMLYLSVMALWFRVKSRVQIWHVLLTAAILSGLLSHHLEPIALVPMVLLPIAIIYQAGKSINHGIRALLFLAVILLCLGLGAHLFPGFHNLKVLNQIYISKDAIPFSLSINFDESIVGIFILGLSHQLIKNKFDWLNLFKRTIPLMIGIIFIIIISAILLGLVRFDPKLPDCTPIWIITNLFLVSTAEEAFFRGFLQRNFTEVLKKYSYGNYIAIICASLLFGIAHYVGGIKYILLATIAGIGYGLVYDRTRRIEASILTHFALNLTHFLLFTYPMLAS